MKDESLVTRREYIGKSFYFSEQWADIKSYNDLKPFIEPHELTNSESRFFLFSLFRFPVSYP